ncbi:MAG: molybdopterin oxidoreductase family protein [Deltaproteobacteria bacterium]|nr:molybdopterin oxidoreductase family protein [Deltaproteobacteria bacterium]
MRKLGTCTLCEAACGIVVDVDERGAVASIRGDDEDPVSRGYVCPKVVGMQDLHEDPDRLRRPLVRDGDSFREATWDEALDRAAEGIRRVQEQHGKDAVAVYQGNPTAHNLGLMTIGQLVFRTLGTKNLYSASSVDQVPHMRASHDMFGHVFFMPVPDIERTDFWLVVGANPVVSNGSIMTAPDVKRRIAAIKGRGGKVVVIDPRRTETAELADRHLFARPGTDALVLFALLHVVFASGLARPGSYVTGVKELEALAKRFTPERVAAVTGIAAGDLWELGRDFAKAERAAPYVRVGTCHQEHGTLVSWLAYSLAAITGNLDREGGLMWTTPAADMVRIADLVGLRGHGTFRSRVRGLPETAGELPVAVLAEEIETPGKGQVRALVTSAGNPVLSTPNGKRLDRALASLEHMVCIDGYLNETTRHAHVILPPCSPLQRAHYDLALNAFGVENAAKWVDPPLPRGPHEKDDGEIAFELALRLRLRGKGKLFALAERLGRSFGPERVVDLALRTGPRGLGRGGLSVAELRKKPHGVVLGPLERRLPGMLRTRSGKVELAPEAFVREVPALEGMLSEPVPSLVLIGRRHLRSNNSWLHNSQRLVKGPRRCTLLVHPDDAAARGLRQGDHAKVATSRGEVTAEVALSDEMMRGVVSLPHGWGHDRAGTRLGVAQAHAGVSANDLTDESRLDRLTGNAAFSALPVEVTAASAAIAASTTAGS